MRQDNVQQLKTMFEKPPSIYRPAPLWVWNDRMDKEVIATQLRDLHAHGYGGAFVHPRPGLVTEYLSDEWFDHWAYALEEARRLGLKLYIYDENSYPSGFAGGHVPSQLPDCLATSIACKWLTADQLQHYVNSPMLNRPGNPVRAYAYETRAGSGNPVLTKDLTLLPVQEWAQYGSRFCVLEISVPETNTWLGGFAYVDVLRPEVAKLFIETTYAPYAEAFGEYFGEHIPAIFTDEPEISPGNLFQEGTSFLPFSYWFASQFEQRNGYDLKDYLPCLFTDAEWADAEHPASKVRFDYYETIRELWVSNWVVPISAWCQQQGIAYTGHYLEHNWPFPGSRLSPGVMSLYEYMHWPAIDMLTTSLLEEDGIEAQLMLTIREAHSAANQFGHKRVLCEAFGAGGWDSSFKDYKRIGDWLFVNGITFMNQHLTYSTIAGVRKRDHPQSFDWRQPWWEQYTLLNDYYARLSAILSSGRTDNRILLLNPTTSPFCLSTQDISGETEEGEVYHRLMKSYLSAAQWLCQHGWNYDLADEYILERHGQVVEGGHWQVGQCRYDVVIIHEMTINLKSSTVKQLQRLLQSGGTVIAVGQPGGLVDGVESEQWEELVSHSGWVKVLSVQDIHYALKAQCKEDRPIIFRRPDMSHDGFMYLERVMEDGSRFLFLTHSSPKPFEQVLEVQGTCVEQWDLWTGEAEVLAVAENRERAVLSVRLAQGESMLLRVSDPPMPSAPVLGTDHNCAQDRGKPSNAIGPANDLTVQAESANMVVIDYCDLVVGTKRYTDISTIYASKLAFEHHGFADNPWDCSVQFKRRLLDQEAELKRSGSGYRVAYRFMVAEGCKPADVHVLAERPELIQLYVNGAAVQDKRQATHWDHHMGKWSIAEYIRPGSNEIELLCSPFSIFAEIEPIYLEGNFLVQPGEKEWILNAPAPLTTGSWRKQGYPFYGGAVLYKQEWKGYREGTKVFITLPNWKGTVASLVVNGQHAGMFGLALSERIEITQWLQIGSNELILRVAGSLKNMLGPHHDPDKPRQVAWPGNWKKAPLIGRPNPEQYDLIDYGLFEPFVIEVEEYQN
ncbi:glycosyl hydrolase [Paenibacillus sp. strain BS8-2]